MLRVFFFIKIEHNNDSLAVDVMYRPPSANVEYFTSMLDVLDQIYSTNNNVILFGDLNHDYYSSMTMNEYTMTLVGTWH